ncbi:MAG: hypothetical protein C0464_03435 [Cyanobacteria bacterium DS2.008]|nr:hypothetical protein [Cyanobacteria bacterium DS2.008]
MAVKLQTERRPIRLEAVLWRFLEGSGSSPQSSRRVPLKLSGSRLEERNTTYLAAYRARLT